MKELHVKKGDKVIVLSGKEKGKTGKVMTALPAEGKVVVEDVNMITAHTKPKRQGEPGGIIKKEGALRACKVMRVCDKCKKPTRVAYQIGSDGKKVKICKKCGELL